MNGIVNSSAFIIAQRQPIRAKKNHVSLTFVPGTSTPCPSLRLAAATRKGGNPQLSTQIPLADFPKPQPSHSPGIAHLCTAGQEVRQYDSPVAEPIVCRRIE